MAKTGTVTAKKTTKKTAKSQQSAALLAGAEQLAGKVFANSRKPMSAEMAAKLIERGELLSQKLKGNLTAFQRTRSTGALVSIITQLRLERLPYVDMSQDTRDAVEAAMFRIVTAAQDAMYLIHVDNDR